MSTDKVTPQTVKDHPVSDAKPFNLLGLTFASRKVLSDFLLASLLVIVIPLAMVFSTRAYLQDDTSLSQTMKTAYTVVPAVIFINVVMGVYVYKVIKDPENYKKDPPLVIKPKKQ